MNRKVFSACLALYLVMLMYVPVASAEASGETGGNEIRISTSDELREFSRLCTLDSFSEGLSVYLDADIDISDAPFSPVPTFSGCFDGLGHSITGFVPSTDGSHQGFFRYVQEGAEIKNLSVSGSVTPGNSRCQVGGIAGENRGLIVSCCFSGRVAGLNYVGGIAGINFGDICGCECFGTVDGKRFTGGIVGYSEGSVLNCVNRALVNTEITTGGVELDNLNLSNFSGALSFINAQDSDIVSDSGGIAGYSKGSVISCDNYGAVGYPHYGYNVGGIAGRQGGSLSSCSNYAPVAGRKDVGGVAGQAEPYLRLKDQRLIENEISTLAALISRALLEIGDTADNISNALNVIQSYSYGAYEDIYDSLPQPPVLPDDDPDAFDPSSVFAEDYSSLALELDRESLQANIDGLASGIAYLSAAISDGTGIVVQDLQAVNEQGALVLSLLTNAISGDNSLTLYEDISADAGSEDSCGRIDTSSNLGSVSGDTNIGGIAGCMAVEYEFDMEDAVLKAVSSATDGKISEITFLSRCVVYACENRGMVTARKDNAGGIAGFESTGCVYMCQDYGDVFSENGGYVGGITGRSDAFISSCYAMCRLDGEEYVGGIAGLGKKITSCGTMVSMGDVTACFGAIAGYINNRDESAVSCNSFVSPVLGAVDGISYSGMAEASSYEAFISSEAVPDEFRALSLDFVADNEVVLSVPFAYGDALSSSLIPDVPEKAGYTGAWEEYDFSCLTFSDTVHAVYTPRLTAAAAETSSGSDASARVLVEGDFSDSVFVSVSPWSGGLPEIENGAVLEAWEVNVSDEGISPDTEFTLRCKAPESDARFSAQSIYVLKNGVWEEVPSEILGSYLAFKTSGENIVFCTVEQQSNVPDVVYYAAGAFLAAVAALTVKNRIVKRRKKTSSTDN